MEVTYLLSSYLKQIKNYKIFGIKKKKTKIKNSSNKILNKQKKMLNKKNTKMSKQLLNRKKNKNKIILTNYKIN